MSGLSIRRIALSALLLALVGQACSTSRTSEESRGWAFRGESDGFVVAALLTDDFPALIREWQKTGSPRLKSSGTGKLGGSLNVAFLVSGCRPAIDGKCNVIAEVVVTNADGDVRARARIEDLCPDQNAPPPNRFMLCGRTPAVDNKGTPEKLAISARVADLHSDRSASVKLVAEFR
jgi:hypothetical protein